ncbi:MAG: phosphodiester glycosidase family protein [Verrucomicrobiota bacterium]
MRSAPALLILAFLTVPPLRAEEPAAEAGAAFRTAVWKPVFQGVDLAKVTAARPRPVSAHVLRVNLNTPGVRLLATPDNGDAPGETTSQLTSSFLKAWHCQAAVNAAPFDKVYPGEGLPENIVGLQISGGKTVSPANDYPALVQMDDGTLRISAPPYPDKGIREAVSGFQIILRNGKNTATDTKLHPRTGAAISSDGRTLWLLAVDGRQAGFSEGCTTVEMGAWFSAMGAVDGINLDGGGTTTMVTADAQGNPQVLNRPIHLGITGRERPSGSHLGIFAKPLPASAEKK